MYDEQQPPALTDKAPRAWAWVFGAREVDEPEGAERRFTDYEKNWDAQIASAKQWEREHGYESAGYSIWSINQPDTPDDNYDFIDRLIERRVSTMVIPGTAIRDTMSRTWESWLPFTTALEAAGIVIKITDHDAGGPTS